MVGKHFELYLVTIYEFQGVSTKIEWLLGENVGNLQANEEEN